MGALANIDHCFRLAAADIDAGDQRAFSLIDYEVVRCTLAGAFEPGQLDQRALGLVGKARQYPRQPVGRAAFAAVSPDLMLLVDPASGN